MLKEYTVDNVAETHHRGISDNTNVMLFFWIYRTKITKSRKIIFVVYGINLPFRYVNCDSFLNKYSFLYLILYAIS